MSSAEQQARDMLERAGVPDAQDMSSSALVEIANLIGGVERPADRDLTGAGELWQTLFPTRFPKHWRAIMALLSQDEQHTLKVALAGYQQGLAALPVQKGDRVRMRPDDAASIRVGSGWWPYRVMLTNQAGTVTHVGYNPYYDRWEAQVTYSPVWMEGPDGEQMRASRPDASFVMPVDWLEVVE